MKIKLLIASLLYWSITSDVLIAQKEFNLWYFGENAGIDFNSGSPMPLTNGNMDAEEGCSSISDSNGDLLFYTDGQNAWDRNHNLMPNGYLLGGGASSTQGALIIPFPGNSSMFYIFTTEDIGGIDKNTSYSVVDMSLNGGNGDVTIKNNVLMTSTAEKLTAVRHANNTDVWVMSHGAFDNNFYSFLVTPSGVSFSPVISTVGQILFSIDITGQMKFSPDGSKIAFGAENYNFIDLFDFNAATGVVTNEIYLTLPNQFEYGLEFSPNGNYLYGANGNHIYQWNITSNDSAIINGSLQLIGTSVGAAPYVGSLQMGPDGKIYVTEYNAPFLGVINYPDSSGLSCNYVDNAVSLSGKISKLGLPNYITSYFLHTGISNNQFPISDFKIFPNPATDKIYISFPATTSENIITKIFSITGEVVFAEENKTATNYFTKTIDVKDFSNGIYFLSVQTMSHGERSRTMITKKIVVQH